MKRLMRLLGSTLAGAGALLFLLLMCSPVVAQEGEKHEERTQHAHTEPDPIGVPSEELSLFVKKLRRPEYIHVLLNPIPVTGSALGALALVVAMILKSSRATFTGLLIVFLSSATAGPVLWFGERAYDELKPTLSADAAQWLDLHMERAETFAYVYYATALLALGGLLTTRRTKMMRALAVLALIGAVACTVLGVWIAHAGGQIIHSEWREGPPPTPMR